MRISKPGRPTVLTADEFLESWGKPKPADQSGGVSDIKFNGKYRVLETKIDPSQFTLPGKALCLVILEK